MNLTDVFVLKISKHSKTNGTFAKTGTHVYSFVKTHQAFPLKSVHVIMCNCTSKNTVIKTKRDIGANMKELPQIKWELRASKRIMSKLGYNKNKIKIH